MDYMQMFAVLSDAVIKMVGSVIIVGAGVLALIGTIWLLLWIGKHLVRYVYKVGDEIKECFTPLEETQKERPLEIISS